MGESSHQVDYEILNYEMLGVDSKADDWPMARAMIEITHKEK